MSLALSAVVLAGAVSDGRVTGARKWPGLPTAQQCEQTPGSATLCDALIGLGAGEL